MNSKSLSFTNNAGSGRHAFNPCTWGAELLSVKPSGVHSKFWDSQGKGKGWVKELHWITGADISWDRHIKFNPFGLKHIFKDTIKTSKTDFIKQNRKYCYMTRIPYLRKPAILFTYFIRVLFNLSIQLTILLIQTTYSSSLNLKKPAIVFLLQNSL